MCKYLTFYGFHLTSIPFGGWAKYFINKYDNNK